VNFITRAFGWLIAAVAIITFLGGLLQMAPVRCTILLVLGLIAITPIIAFRLGVGLLVWVYQNAWMIAAAIFALIALAVFSF
jgi:hypothetical protein